MRRKGPFGAVPKWAACDGEALDQQSFGSVPRLGKKRRRGRKRKAEVPGVGEELPVQQYQNTSMHYGWENESWEEDRGLKDELRLGIRATRLALRKGEAKNE